MYPPAAPVPARRPAGHGAGGQARMGAIRVLGGQLASDGIEIVTLESTSVIRGLGTVCNGK